MDNTNQQPPVSPNQGAPLSKKQRRRLEKMQQKQQHTNMRTTRKVGARVVFWIIILALIGFFVYAIGKLATSGSNITQPQTDIAITESDHVLGDIGARVHIIEYADFQCPGCAAFHPIVKQITEAYGDKIAYAYRHYPLPQHPHADIMAYAAEAAGKQGKFWEMSDLIYANQKSWSPLISVNKTISEYATRLGLDAAKFESDMDTQEVKDIIESGYVSGTRYGVNSTPTFFLNGVKIALPRSLEEFRTVIDTALLSDNVSTSTPTTN